MASAKQYPKSDHYDGKHFHNIYLTKDQDNGILDYWRWRLFDPPNPNLWPKSVKNTAVPQLPNKIGANEVYITFINHATELIQLNGLTVLTDPVFSERASPLSFAGPKRIRPPALTINQLPKIDVVLISHNHYDHLDLPSIEALVEKDNPVFIVPLKNFHILEKAGVKRMVELDWWQAYPINEKQVVTLLPAQHWSKRTLFDKNESLWGSFLITSEDLKIVFIGDTGYSKDSHDIRERVGPIDVLSIPIGAYDPIWFMKPNHISPEEAVKVHLELGSQLSLANQFDTFQLANEAFGAPVEFLKKALNKHNVPNDKFIAREVGQTIHYQK